MAEALPRILFLAQTSNMHIRADERTNISEKQDG